MFNAQTTDPHLLEAARDWHDDANWREFYERYAPAIRKHAARSGLGDQECEDVVQETMLKVARYLPSFNYNRTVCRFRPWLNQIVNQRILEVIHQRHGSRFNKDAIEDLRVMLQPVAVSGDDPVAQVEAEYRVLEACLARVRASIQPRHWQIFETHCLHGMGARETASVHGTSSANVWVIRHRVVNALRKEWRNLLELPFAPDS
jgi:RNA polymerase sigma-70 factor (ECF subfamily)